MKIIYLSLLNERNVLKKSRGMVYKFKQIKQSKRVVHFASFDEFIFECLNS